jgi:hypothetical protein
LGGNGYAWIHAYTGLTPKSSGSQCNDGQDEHADYEAADDDEYIHPASDKIHHRGFPTASAKSL